MSDNGTPQAVPRVWQYEAGKWVQVPDPLTGGGEGDERLSEAGFIPAGEWFGPAPAVRVYERQEGGECEWRIEVSVTEAGRHVITVRRLPDLLDLLAKLAVIATADEHGQKLAHAIEVTYPYTGLQD